MIVRLVRFGRRHRLAPLRPRRVAEDGFRDPVTSLDVAGEFEAQPYGFARKKIERLTRLSSLGTFVIPPRCPRTEQRPENGTPLARPLEGGRWLLRFHLAFVIGGQAERAKDRG